MNADIKNNASAKEVKLNKEILKGGIIGFFSFFLCNAQIFGGISPFSIAFICAVPFKFCLTTVIGAVLGSFVFARPIYQTYYIIIYAIVFAIKLLFNKLLKGKPKPILLGLVCFCVSGSLGSVFAGLTAGADITLSLLEAILAACLSYFYAISLNLLIKKNAAKIYSYLELISITILAMPLIIAFADVSIFNINIGIIISAIAIYIASVKFNIIGAAISSIVVSISLCFYSLEMLEFCTILIISAFIAGLFSKINKYALIAAFVACSTIGLFLLGAPIFMTYYIISIVLASAVFLFIPVTEYMPTQYATASVTPLKSSIAAKLDYASDTIRDLQTDLLDVAGKFDDIDTENIATIYDSASSKVCKNCTLKLNCWDKNYNDTVRAFVPLNSILKEYIKIEPEQMPSYFKEHCCRIDKLTTEINNCYHAYMVKKNSKRYVKESRGLIIEQFNSMADMLTEVSDEFANIKGYDQDIANLIRKAYSALCYPPNEVLAIIDESGRTSIEIYTDKPVTAQKIKLCDMLSNAAQKEFDLPEITRVCNKTKITLYEKANYSIDFYGEQVCVEGNDICGDCFEYFVDAKGYAYCILSDGMGNGKRAAIDSVMTCSILLKLIKAGFGLKSSLKLINSSLLVKSTDESLATIDLVKIDLYTGQTEFYKAGAATSYLSTKGTLVKINNDSLPIGIINDVNLKQKCIKLQTNDIILMVSDGVVENGDDWILMELASNSHLKAKEISQKILFEATKRNNEKNHDDLTVIAIKLKKGI